MLHFLEACHARDYGKATRYLDLRQLPQSERAKNGQELAKQLEDLLDDSAFEIATLSRDPAGNENDELAPNFDRLDLVHVAGKTLDLQLERVQPKPGLFVWVVSAPSVAMIPEAHQLVAETPFEKKLPQILVTFEVFDTPLWRWLALFLMAAVIWVLSRVIVWSLAAMMRHLVDIPELREPLRAILAIAAFRWAMELAPPSSLPRLYVERGLGLLLFLSFAWAGAVVVDVIARRWHSRLDPRMQAVSYSVLPLGQQVLKVSLFLLAILAVLSAWGYNTSTILAGLGVGGLAVALAAQKTIENLFGGVSVIGDRPVLVGDVCHFGDQTGTVMDIGLRSTRIRTANRTVISVPNGQFSSMSLENISGRDKIRFHQVWHLRKETTSQQLSQVLENVTGLFARHPKVEKGEIPVRFVGVGQNSFDIEVAAYVNTTSDDEFFAIQQELLLKILQAIEQAGTGLAG